MNIRFLVPEMPPIWSYLPDLIRVYKNKQFSNRGEFLQKFENNLKEYFGSRTKPVCVNNATTGLMIAIRALELPVGSKVLVPSMTFAASILAIRNCGLVPVYCDITDTGDFNIETTNIKLQGLSAIMPVCCYGNEISKNVITFARNFDLKIIVDAAGAIGTYYHPYVDAIVYSFHATKTLPVGEGGCVIFYHSDTERTARSLIDFGFDSERTCQLQGINGKMGEVEAVIGIQSLKQINSILTSRRKIKARYELIFSKYIAKGLMEFQPGNGLQLLTVICKDKEFKNLLEYHLNSNGIETRTYYRPCHKNGVLSAEITLKNTEDLYERIFSLPIYSSLTNKELKYIGLIIEKWNIN